MVALLVYLVFTAINIFLYKKIQKFDKCIYSQFSNFVCLLHFMGTVTWLFCLVQHYYGNKLFNIFNNLFEIIFKAK